VLGAAGGGVDGEDLDRERPHLVDIDVEGLELCGGVAKSEFLCGAVRKRS
jgi:hypothetical protein